MTAKTFAELAAARFIGPRNAEAVVGQSWRWCRDHARAWGVPVLRVDAKPLIPVDQFLAALQNHARSDGDESEPDDGNVDDLAKFRERIANAGVPR